MSKGYGKEDEIRYRKMMNMVCDRYHPEQCNLDDFVNKAIPKLPKKMQKTIKTYWGIGGGIDHQEKIKNFLKKKKTVPQAEKNLNDNAMLAINLLSTFDYLVLFNEAIRELVAKVAKKTYGEENELEAAKWADLYATIIINGPHMNYDAVQYQLSPKEFRTESILMLDRAVLLQLEYDGVFSEFNDGELSIPAIKLWEEDLDVRDRVTLHRFFGIEMPKYLREFEGEDILTFMQLRKFKEKIFCNGPWATDGYMFLERGIPNEDTVSYFCRIFELLRSGVKVEKAEPHEFGFGTGKRQISWYKIQDGEEKYFEFPYIEEVLFLRYSNKYVVYA